jgi:probable HAF family extracellular repeat protein
MKSKKRTSVVVMTLFAALAMPVGMAAQDNPLPNNKPKHQKYKLYDLGTFGGPDSNVSTTVQALNNEGAVACSANTLVPDPNGVFPYIFHSCLFQDGTLVDLGSLPGGNNSDANWINARGVIIGWSENGVIDPLVGVPEDKAVLYEGGNITDLGAFGGNQSFGLAINDRDQVVGWALNTIPDPVSAWGFYLGTQMRPFLWQNGVLTDLGTLGGPDGYAAYINNKGQVAGAAFTNSTINPTTGMPTLHPFLWDKGQMLDLGDFGGTFSGTAALNSQGKVAGFMSLPGDQSIHPFLWNRGRLTDLGTFGGNNGNASWMNDAGDVVGTADVAVPQRYEAFLWRKGVMTDLGNLGVRSVGDFINASGQIVGNSRIDSNTVHAFLWENGGPMVDLNTLVPANSSLTLREAVDINDRGEITGNGLPPGCADVDEGKCGHAFLLIPDGDCDDDCEGRIAASQNNAAPAQNPDAMTQGSESPLSPVERFRSQMRQRHHIPRQPAAPRN